jgi:hypothetical protein
MTTSPAIRRAAETILRSRRCQIAGLALTFLLVAAMHRQSDGLWPTGDAARHALNGLFWWDLLTMSPLDPIGFAVRYYARYPVINPATYPPLFYIFEGLTFAVLGPSPHAARGLVLLFAGMAGVYTMAWARRWIGPGAGWAGAFLAFVPGIVMWSNAVMLNIPSTALSLATLYHFRRWLETSRGRQLVAAALFFIASLLTYFPSASVLAICGLFFFLRRRRALLDRSVLWIAVAAMAAAIPLAAALLYMPLHTLRHLPTIEFLATASTWTYYWATLPNLFGWPVLALGLVGVVAGLSEARWRAEAVLLACWLAILIVGLSLVPARDPRYLLPAAPALVIAATIGVASAVRRAARLHPAWQVALLAAGLAVGFWSAARINVPVVAGYREIAGFLQQQGPRDAVLYEGYNPWLLGFYIRAMDPGFDRRVVRADKLLYERLPTATFKPIIMSKVESTQDVMKVLRTQCGCRWVALEVAVNPSPLPARRFLREAVERPEFELVRSFAISGEPLTHRVDLYRLTVDVDPVSAVDLTFPEFGNRTFAHVVPITR